MLLGLEPDDFDVATSARPEQVQQLFRRTIAVGVSFGVVEVLGPKPLKVQVATFRTEGSYSDGRHPDKVEFTSAREDALRRDFTINGMFFDPVADKVIDYVGGEADLQKRILRAIGDPAVRFSEDRLRMLRAVRIAARFGLEVEPATFAAIRAMAMQVITVSGERIAEELRKLLTNANRGRGIELLTETHLWRTLFPELPLLSEPAQVAAGQLGQSPSFPLALATLLGALPDNDLNDIADRLRLSNIERTGLLWFSHQRGTLVNPASLPMHTLKPLLAHPGARELIALHRAFGHASSADYCEARLAEWPPEVLDPPPLITGDDLKAMGLNPGPQFKLILDEVRDAQLDGVLSNRNVAIAFVNDLIKKC
jgi:poly(A) polymerase